MFAAVHESGYGRFCCKGSRETRKPAQALKVFYCRLLSLGDWRPMLPTQPRPDAHATVPFDARDGVLVHVGVGVSMLPVHGRPTPGGHAAAAMLVSEFPVTRVKRRKRRNAFGIDACTIFAVLRVRPVQPAPTHPSPSARQYCLPFKGLAASALRRMFLQR
jgi:hypothetical protein